MVESDCAWATVKDTWTEDVMHQTTKAEKEDPRNDGKNSDYPIRTVSELINDEQSGCVKKLDMTRSDLATNVPQDIIDAKVEDLPKAIDWRDHDGVNYASWSKN
jgi:hypothetical protein